MGYSRHKPFVEFFNEAVHGVAEELVHFAKTKLYLSKSVPIRAICGQGIINHRFHRWAQIKN